MDEPVTHDGGYGQAPEATAIVESVRKKIRRAKGVEKRWRKRAQGGIDFFFGRQWKPADERSVEERGQDAIVNNVLRPTIRLVIGLMLGQPFDWAAKPQGTHDDEAAERVSAGLKYLAGRNRMLEVMRSVYWWGLCYGVAWVVIGPHVRWDDPRREICQIRVVDPREVHPDPESREADGSDLRWLTWSRRMDIADIKRKWKQPALPLVEEAEGDAQDGDGLTVNEAPIDKTPPPSMWDDYDDWNKDFDDDEYDSDAKQATVHETWEVRPTVVWLADLGQGAPVEQDENDLAGMVLRADVRRVWQDQVPKVWKHVTCGPFLLETGRAPAKHDRIPWVPYYYDRDGKGDPWSFIESLKDPQREVNYLHAKSLHELSVPRIRVSRKVLQENGMTLQQFAEHYAKPGSVTLAGPGEIEAIGTGGNTADRLFEASERAAIAIQKSAGSNDHLMGYDTPAESGKSKEISLVQGATIQRDGEAALRAFHQAAGELLLSDMCQYHDDAWTVRITDEVGRDKFVSFNQPGVDPETGAPVILNDINQYAYDLELESVPWSPTMRQKAAARIIELFQSEENPHVRAALRRMAITIDDLPHKAQILDILNEAEQVAAQAAQQAQAEAMAMAGPPPGAAPPDPGTAPPGPPPMPTPPGPAQMPGPVPLEVSA